MIGRRSLLGLLSLAPVAAAAAPAAVAAAVSAARDRPLTNGVLSVGAKLSGLGPTVIEGGAIKTSKIAATAISAGSIRADQILPGSISIGKLHPGVLDRLGYTAPQVAPDEGRRWSAPEITEVVG